MISTLEGSYTGSNWSFHQTEIQIKANKTKKNLIMCRFHTKALTLFFNISTIDMLSWIILCCYGLSVHHRMLYPLDASIVSPPFLPPPSLPLSSTAVTVNKHCQMSPGRQKSALLSLNPRTTVLISFPSN